MITEMWLEENGDEYVGRFTVESNKKPIISGENNNVLLVDGVKIEFDEPIHFMEENDDGKNCGNCKHAWLVEDDGESRCYRCRKYGNFRDWDYVCDQWVWDGETPIIK